jgi:hypothetical protein
MRNTKFLLIVFSFVIIFCLPNLSVAAELIINGGFENTPDFNGWTRVNSANSWRPILIGTVGQGGGFQSVTTITPQEGTKVAWNGMADLTNNNSQWSFHQDVTIPSGNGVTITWKDRFQVNHTLFCPGGTCQPKSYFVEIVNPISGAIIAEMYRVTVTGNVNRDTGWVTHTYVLLGQGGNTVRLRFRGTETVAITGPGQLEVDAVSMNSFVPTYKNQMDYDGDGKSDVSVFRASDGGWYIQRSQAGFYAVAWSNRRQNCSG